MFHHKPKTGYFILEGLNAYATAFYFNYLFFYMRLDYGFGNLGNFFVSAFHGLIYMSTAWFGGRVAQNRGYFYALRLGFIIMALVLALGSQLSGVVNQFVVMGLWTFGMCFTWPTLEGLISENETRAGLSRMIGLYNVVWAAGGALAYFTGGALLENLGRGSLFWLPVALHILQLGIVLWLEKSAGMVKQVPVPGKEGGKTPAGMIEPPRALAGKTFLRMAWLANPFAYIAMNTAIPVMPDLAARLGLSTTLAGFVCSVWMFTRLFAFIGLWRWNGWHYRFNWLVAAYILMIISFASLLLVPLLWVVVVAQIVFGLAVGLIYYSSLYYSMDLGETKGEHGGLHETAIGAGMFMGPLVGATILRIAPNIANVSIWTVTTVLIVGLVGLVALNRQSPRNKD